MVLPDKIVYVAICRLAVQVAILGAYMAVPIVDSLIEAVSASSDIDNLFVDAVAIEAFFIEDRIVT